MPIVPSGGKSVSLMATQIITQRLTLKPEDPHRLANLCGHLNENLQQIEKSLTLKIKHRGNTFNLMGEDADVTCGQAVLEQLYQATGKQEIVSPELVHLTIKEAEQAQHYHDQIQSDINHASIIKTPKLSVKTRGVHQLDYVNQIHRTDINFGIGPAGTGKTYLAVACAVEALVKDQVQRILLVRPAVEAGEKLGFLPGDLAQKIDPYLRPLYDALYEMLGVERVGRLIEKNVIEVAPLAYMRGRTLNNAFIILDESQNTTTSQMKMFLTRLGFGSTVVITGDVSQIDLPQGTRSGLVHVTQVLKDIDGISFTWFDSKDVVRHSLVQKIVDAYDKHDQNTISTLSNRDLKTEGSHERDA